MGNETTNKMLNIITLTDAGVGFLTAAAILQQELEQEKIFEQYFPLSGVYYTNLIFAIEMFFKAILVQEGYDLDKLKTHKVYQLFCKLAPNTRQQLIDAVNGDGRKHWSKLENVLIYYDDKAVQIRYNDLQNRSTIIKRDGDVLEHLAIVLCHRLGRKILVHGKEWNLYKD